MGRKLIQAVGHNLDSDPTLAPLLPGRYSEQFAIFLCDTEADLPTPKYGNFAVCKDTEDFYVGFAEEWRVLKTKKVT